MSLIDSATTSEASVPSAPPSPPLAARPRAQGRGERERRRTLAKYVRRGLAALVVLVGVAGLALAFRPKPVPVDSARALRGPLTVAIEESGMTRIKDRYLVSAPTSGSLSRIALEAGDVVKEGDVLAELAPALSPLLDERARAEGEARLGAALAASKQAGSQVARATAAKELADRDLVRLKQLAASGSIASQSLEQGEFASRMRGEEMTSAAFAEKVANEEVRVARAALGRDGDRAHARHLDILAPASGRVLSVQRKSAGVVQAGSPLVEVGDPSALEVVVDLLTTDAVHIQPGTEVLIGGWGGEQPLTGRVRLVEPSAFTRPSALGVDEQRVNVVISLTMPREAWGALGDGYRVEARFVLWQSSDVLKVPIGAVFRHGDRWATFRLDGDVAHLVTVEIGHRGDTEVEVVSGLAPNAAVAVHPGDRVKDGARVEAR